MKEIEHIDPKYYNILNDYIRVGKRLLFQKENLLKPLYRRKKELYNQLADNFSKYKTETFQIHITTVCGDPYKNITITCMPRTWDSNGFWEDVEINTANTFKDMFKGIINKLEESYYLQVESTEQTSNDVLEELYDLIYTIKKDNALLFFEYIKVRERYNKVSKAISRKDTTQTQRYNTIKAMWNKDNFPQSGMPVKYIANNYRDQREGTIVKLSDDYQVTYIKTKGNKTIQRDTSCVTWPNKFQDTVLCSCLTQLYACIPEIWKEKKLDFFS